MQWKHEVLMDLAFDCNKVDGVEDDELDICRLAYTKIENFLAGEGEDPAIGDATKRLDSDTNILSMTVKIPHPNDEESPEPSVADVGALYTKLKNSLDQFPPLVGGALPKFKFIAKCISEEPVE